MSRVDELALTEVGVEAAIGLREILTKVVAGKPVATYVTEQALPWEIIASGGWDVLGAPESVGGGGASLRDLVEVARVWGETILPAPLIPTIMAKRWSSTARAQNGPVTVSIATRTSGGRGVAAFGGTPGVQMLVNLGGEGVLLADTKSELDSYAPSLRLVECSELTVWSGVAASELRVIWAAEASGCATRMLSDAVAYAKEHQQFGQPIGKFQAIKHHLANAYMLAEQAETAVIMASLEPNQARAASLFAFDASLKVIEIAIQVHGGLGFTWEMGLHMYLRHVSALRELASALPE